MKLHIILIATLLLVTSCTKSSVTLLTKKDHTTSVQQFQQKLNEEFKSKQSPLSPEKKATFTSHNFFPIQSDYQVLADFKRTPEEKPFAMPTSSDKTPIYIKFAEAIFQLKGETFKLNLYRNPKLSRIPQYKYHLFLPFTDLTNGDTTYDGGRYIDLVIPKGNKIIIDFNKAYNPYCYYGDGYACPIPPRGNFLDTEIEAGIKVVEK